MLLAADVTTYELPADWERPIRGYTGYLRASGRSRETICARRKHLRATARHLGNHSAFTVTYDDLIAMFGQAEWSNYHRRSRRTALVAFYDWAIAAKLTTRNPANQLPKVADPPPRPRPTPDDVWNQLLAAADPRTTLIARLAAEAGLRRSEIAQVNADDLVIDLGGWSLIVHGKGGRQRVVPLTDSLADAIRAYRTSGYLFPGRFDGHISPGYLSRLVSRLMPGWSLHTLRHRYASRGFAGTGNLRAVQLALGHSSVATTQIYTAVSTRDVRAVSDAAAAS